MNDRIHARLARAAGSGAPVRPRRSIPGAERLEGFVVGRGAERTLRECAGPRLGRGLR